MASRGYRLQLNQLRTRTSERVAVDGVFARNVPVKNRAPVLARLVIGVKDPDLPPSDVMTPSAHDTLQEHNQSNRRLVESLIAAADTHLASNKLDAALVLLLNAFSIEPKAQLLQSAGDVYSAMTDKKFANLYRKRIVPPAAEIKFFEENREPRYSDDHTQCVRQPSIK